LLEQIKYYRIELDCALKLRQGSCIVSETSTAQLETSAVAPPVESKYIVKSRVCVMLMAVGK